MAEFTHSLIEANGRSTEVLTAGTGAPVVFLHGGGIVEGFDCFLPIAERFRLIAPLFPGYGRTALDPPVRSRDDAVEHVTAVLDSLGLDETVLVGHSLGGWLAAATAARLPDRISKLMLGAPYGLHVEGQSLAHLFTMGPEERLAALTNDASIWEGRLPQGHDETFEAARALEGESLSRFFPGEYDPELAATLTAVSQPTLILWGEDDKIFPVVYAQAWQTAIPHADLTTFPGVGHLLFHERREAVDAVIEFATR
jgi:pimeloyl-ACP methyl ester carboxylesterase